LKILCLNEVAKQKNLRSPGLKHCWPKAIYCICQPKKREIKKKLEGPSKNLGRHGPPRPSLRIATVPASGFKILLRQILKHQLRLLLTLWKLPSNLYQKDTV